MEWGELLPDVARSAAVLAARRRRASPVLAALCRAMRRATASDNVSASSASNGVQRVAAHTNVLRLKYCCGMLPRALSAKGAAALQAVQHRHVQ